MEQANSSKHRATDRSSDKSRRSSAPEKHEDKVSAGDAGKNRLSSGVVRMQDFVIEFFGMGDLKVWKCYGVWRI